MQEVEKEGSLEGLEGRDQLQSAAACVLSIVLLGPLLLRNLFRTKCVQFLHLKSKNTKILKSFEVKDSKWSDYAYLVAETALF